MKTRLELQYTREETTLVDLVNVELKINAVQKLAYLKC
jgi:hypothetical protein